MPTKVLVFESDPSFAGELRTELTRLGLVAQVVDDGTAGLMAAASDKPDLILLSIELPRMNGFSVCNKLKKDPALKDVPLIIMSSESSDETFEQHRKLRTRAEDYVHKPIAFGELLEHMRPYVEIENGAGPVSGIDDAPIIIEDVDLSDSSAPSANGAPSEGSQPRARRVDAEVEAFANTAFDRLLESEPPGGRQSEPPKADESTRRSSSRAPRPPIAPRFGSSPPRPTTDAEVERLRAEMERQKTELARMERELSAARSEVQRLEEAARSESGANDEVVRLQRQLDELRLKAPSGGKVGGVSSREFLDLREALNKKDKEILSLRDQVTRKEKDLLDASDSALALEREKADFEDRIGALEKDLQSAKTLADSAKADKEQATKRAEDFKARGERLKADLEAKSAELASHQKRHEEELTAALNEVRQTEQRAREEEVATLKQTAAAEKSAAVVAREKELGQEHDRRLAALYRSNEEEQNRLKGELTKAAEEAETLRARLAERERELGEQRQQELDAQKTELEGKHAEQMRLAETQATDLRNELASRIEERDETTRELAQKKESLGKLEAELHDAMAELSTTKEKLAEQARRVETATQRWEQNRASLEQAKDALAAAVAQIEEAEARGVE